MAAQLDRLVGGLNESLLALEQLHTAASGQQTILNSQGEGCEKQLHSIRDAALGSLVEVQGLLDGIRTQGELVLGMADYVAVADDALRNLQEKMSAAAELAAVYLGDRRGQAPALVTALRQDYTMASERQVFESVVGSRKKAATSPAPAAIELFEDSPPPKSAAVTAPVSSGDVELF
jgi:hypothetical protein